MRDSGLLMAIALLLTASVLQFGGTVRAETDGPSPSPGLPRELHELNRRGEVFARVRQQALEILAEQNGCAAWFHEADANAPDVFRSLRFELDPNGVSHVSAIRNDRGLVVFKHPWAAKVVHLEGRNSLVWINDQGPFFIEESPVDTPGFTVSRVPWRRLTIGAYNGDTDEARITILLHELGHVTGRIPNDDGSWNGQSTRNTEEVLRHCRREVESIARRIPRSSN